jgi:hypothetical protein
MNFSLFFPPATTAALIITLLPNSMATLDAVGVVPQ